MQEQSKKKTRVIFGIVTVLHWFSLYTYMPYYTPYLKSLGAAATLIGMAAGIYGFAQMILRIPIGIVADKTGKKRIFVSLGLLTSLLAALGMRFFTHPVLLLLMRGLSGVSAATWVCFPLLYASYFSEEESTKAIGQTNAMNNFGRLTATFAGGLIAGKLGVLSSFSLAVVAGVIGLILSFFVLDIPTNREPVALKELVKVIGNKMLLLGCILACLLQAIAFSTAFAFTSNIASELGASAFALSMVTTLFTLTNFLAALVVGSKLVAKLGERTVITFAFALMAVYCILMPFAPNVVCVCLLQFMGGWGNGLLGSMLMAMAVRTVPVTMKSTAMGAYQAIYGVGMTVGPILMGKILDHTTGYGTGYLTMAGIALGAIVLLQLTYKKAKESVTTHGTSN